MPPVGLTTKCEAQPVKDAIRQGRTMLQPATPVIVLRSAQQAPWSALPAAIDRRPIRFKESRKPPARLARQPSVAAMAARAAAPRQVARIRAIVTAILATREPYRNR